MFYIYKALTKLKLGEVLNKHSLKEDMQMTNNHKEKVLIITSHEGTANQSNRSTLYTIRMVPIKNVWK